MIGLNLGGGRLRIPGFLNVDREPSPEVDVVWDLARHPWPFADESAEEIRAWHVLEHLPGYALHEAMDELHRVLLPGGLLYVKVPYLECPLTNLHHFHTFGRRSFDPWIEPRDDGGADCCNQSRHAYFRRWKQEIWAYADGFPMWHLRRHLPRFSEGRFVFTNERDCYARYRSLTGYRERELREWLVRA